jgi:hypothetical protein
MIGKDSEAHWLFHGDQLLTYSRLDLFRMFLEGVNRITPLPLMDYTPKPSTTFRLRSSLRMRKGNSGIYNNALYRKQWINRTPRIGMHEIITHAQMLHDAGFHDIDELEYSYGRGHTLLMKTLEYRKTSLGFWDPLQHFLLSWLIDNGARLDKKDSLYDYALQRAYRQTPASHYVGNTLIHHLTPLFFLQNEDFLPKASQNRVKKLVSEVIAEPTRDSCNCACSTNGCVPIVQMLKGCQWLEQVFRGVSTGLNCWGYQVHDSKLQRIAFFRWLDDNIPLTPNIWHNLSNIILRFLTFREMELTYTCCTCKYSCTFD